MKTCYRFLFLYLLFLLTTRSKSSNNTITGSGQRSQNCTMGEIGTVFSDVDNCVEEMEADDRSFIEKKGIKFTVMTDLIQH